MNEVKIILEGHAKQVAGGWLASSNVSLVQSNGKKVIVDPGCDRPGLLKALEENELKTSDIDFVYLTHNHTDHILLTAIFERAKVLNESEIYDNDFQVEHGGKIPGTDLQIIPTPGHDQFHSSLIVKTPEGTYAVAGDVFWWMDGEKQETNRDDLAAHQDMYVKDEKEIKASREKILDIADFIIPGHGKIIETRELR